MKYSKRKGLKVVGMVLILISVFVIFNVLNKPSFVPDSSQDIKTVKDLGISMPVFNGEWIDLYNSFARDGDLKTSDACVFLENAMNKESVFENDIASIERGFIIYNFASYKLASENVDYLKDKIDGISYDLELWEKSKNEGDDILISSQRMSEITRRNNLYYFGGLSYQLAKKEGSVENMVKYLDVYGPHSHAYMMEDPEGYIEFLRNQTVQAKKGNPDVVIDIMVSTAEEALSVEELYGIIESCLDFTDRVTIYHSNTPESFEKTKILIEMLRE